DSKKRESLGASIAIGQLSPLQSARQADFERLARRDDDGMGLDTQHGRGGAVIRAFPPAIGSPQGTDPPDAAHRESRPATRDPCWHSGNRGSVPLRNVPEPGRVEFGVLLPG